MSCIICDDDKSKNIIYSNEKIIVSVAQKSITSGHIQIFPKKHITILEQLSDEESEYLINAANKVSMILYSTMNINGTNILINNGTSAGQEIPHFCIDIIPRRENDGLMLEWDTKQSSNESLDNMQRIISENILYEDKKNINNSDYNNIENKNNYLTADESKNNKTQQESNKESNEEKIKKNEVSTNKINKSEEQKKVNYWLKSFERIP
ncbi:MAG: HIT family protein [Candidatus Woesearchaeota archaeon]